MKADHFRAVANPREFSMSSKMTLPDWAALLPKPQSELVSTFSVSTRFGQIINLAMMGAEREYCGHLLAELDRNNIEGDIVEFGVFDGGWLETIANFCEKLNSPRKLYGFDSFEGLPEGTEHDLNCWEKGQFAADYEVVCARLKTKERPWINLRKGWFSDTLPKEHGLDRIAYARIDCDLYSAAVECLEFLSARLVHGAILVFDDWTYNEDKGETKACYEWLVRNPKVSLEFLAANSIGHFYFKTHIKG